MNTLTKKHSSIALLALQCIAILLSFNSISCNCNDNPGSNQPSNGNILMQVPTDPLIGNNKTVEVSFTLADSNQEATLEGLKLHVTLQETGGIGSQISYPNATAMSKLDKPLQEVLHLEKLTSATSPCKVPFTFIITDAKTTQLEAKFELLDPTDNLINQGTVTWKAAAPSINLALNLTSPDKLEDDQKTISLQIQNKGTEKTAHNQLKLKVTRQEGNSAELLHGHQLLGKQNVYLVDLPTLKPQATLPYELTINPEDDSQVTFILELVYQGQNIGSPITVTWKKTNVLRIYNFRHDKITGQVSCSIENTGTAAANHIKVSCTTQTPGAQLAGSASQEIIIGNLEPNKKKSGFKLGKLNLGGGNKSALFVFTFSYEEDGTRKTMPPILQTFINANIEVSVSITDYDPASRKVGVTIYNGWGSAKAEGLKLVYKNKSADAQGKIATLDNQQESTVNIGDLDQHAENSQTFQLDFKEAEAATFYFEVQYDNNPIAAATGTFLAQPIDLALSVNNDTLYGPDHEIKLTITDRLNKGLIKIEDLKLLVEKEVGEGATISNALGGAAISEIIGAALGNLGDELTFYLNPTPGAKSATFTFQLQYRGKDIGKPATISWQEYTLWIEESEGRLVGNEEGSFTVNSDAPIDLLALTATLESEQGTAFELIKLDGQVGGTSLPLEQVTNGLNNPINFKVTQKNGQQKAKVNVIIKRGTTELARKEVTWVDQGIKLGIKISNNFIPSDQESTITIENTTNNPLDLRSIQVKLTNTADWPIILGKASGTGMHKTLAELVGQDELVGQEKVTTTIKLAKSDSLTDKLVSGATLVFLDPQGEILKKEYLLFYELTILNKLSQGKDKLTQEIENNKNNIRFLVQISSPIEKAAKVFEILPQKLDEIVKKDAGYQNLLNTGKKEMTDIYVVLDKARINVQTAISNILISNSKEISAMKKSIKGFVKRMEGIDDTDRMIKLLSADYNEFESMDQQSIRGLYEHYHELIDRLKDSLDQAGITELKPLPEDLPSIKEVKTLYQAMVADLPALHKESQEALNAGFEVLKSAIENKQQEIQQNITVAKHGGIDSGVLYSLIGAKKISLQRLQVAKKNLLKVSEDQIGVDPTTWYNFMAGSYQALAAPFASLVQFDIADPDLLEEDIDLILGTLYWAKDLTNPLTATTKQAAIKIAQVAIQAVDSLKQARSENYVFNGTNGTTVKELLQQLNQQLTQLQS